MEQDIRTQASPGQTEAETNVAQSSVCNTHNSECPRKSEKNTEEAYRSIPLTEVPRVQYVAPWEFPETETVSLYSMQSTGLQPVPAHYQQHGGNIVVIKN